MSAAFRRILKEHRERYPLMQPQDYGKLAFQGEFGAEHLAAGRQTVLEYILEERKSFSAQFTPPVAEDIGGGLCRFPLASCQTDAGAKLLADLFMRTAAKSRGTKEGLLEKMDQMAEYGIPGMQEWLAAWKEKGCPPVHHSETYRNAYHPHYRLLQKDFAAYFPALLEISLLLQPEEAARLAGMGSNCSGKPVIIGIDGRCGSGKTHFAELVGSLFPCNVIHMDDFYLPAEKRRQNWEQIPGGNMDFERLNREILTPIREEKQARYQPYDCSKGRLGEAKLLGAHRLTVIEGSYSHHPKLKTEYRLKVFLTCGQEEQAGRLKEREGSYYAMFVKRWIPMEENYIQCYKIEAGSDLRLDTSAVLCR